MEDKIKLGISTCLLGENVRYDGGHKLNRYLVNTVSSFVDWEPVCPEVECGLPTPREAMHLVGKPDEPRLVTVKTGIDHTGRMQAWSQKRLDELEKEELLQIIDHYHQHLVPLIVPVTLLNHYIRKFQQPYLLKQYFLNPHPMELMLRNHV